MCSVAISLFNTLSSNLISQWCKLHRRFLLAGEGITRNLLATDRIVELQGLRGIFQHTEAGEHLDQSLCGGGEVFDLQINKTLKGFLCKTPQQFKYNEAKMEKYTAPPQLKWCYLTISHLRV